MKLVSFLCLLNIHKMGLNAYDPHEGGIWSNPEGSLIDCFRCGRPSWVLKGTRWVRI